MGGKRAGPTDIMGMPPPSLSPAAARGGIFNKLSRGPPMDFQLHFRDVLLGWDRRERLDKFQGIVQHSSFLLISFWLSRDITLDLWIPIVCVCMCLCVCVRVCACVCVRVCVCASVYVTHIITYTIKS
jgi:hypothetical protein